MTESDVLVVNDEVNVPSLALTCRVGDHETDAVGVRGKVIVFVADCCCVALGLNVRTNVWVRLTTNVSVARESVCVMLVVKVALLVALVDGDAEDVVLRLVDGVPDNDAEGVSVWLGVADSELLTNAV